MKKKLLLPTVCATLAMLFLFAGCLPFSKKELTSTNFLENGTSIPTGENATSFPADGIVTTAPAEQTSIQEGPPSIITYYMLYSVKKIDEYFTAGFDVKLPKIDSDKLGALQINAEIDELKVNIEKHYDTSGDLGAYKEYTECYYETAMKGSVIFISLKTAHGLMESEYTRDDYYYAYDYAADKQVSNTDIALMFNLSASQVVTIVNTALVQKGSSQVTGFDKIDLFVNTAGKLMADAKVDSEMGSDYSEIIELK